MVTARYFEERMISLVEDSGLKPIPIIMEDACMLMMETLESLGYSAGVDVLRNRIKADKDEW